MSLNRKGFRRALLSASALAGAAMMAAAAPAFSQEREVQFDLPAQPLSEALRQYGFAADQPLIFAETDVRALTAPPLRGTYTPEQGLQTLLAGTGLHAERTSSGIVRIVSDQAPQGGSAAGGGAEVEELIVTAQKKEEAIQDVPIAISAFTQKSLDAQKIEGGFDLLKAIPNVTFSKNNFSGYNFSIRGIGTKAISATTDPGVAVSFNNTTLIVNRLFEQEYYDVERVEVLRGPQGTLYGRNATSGVINVLSARPRLGEFEADLKLEGGNYNAMRGRGMVNIPIGDKIAIRAAGAFTKRDGYGINLAATDPNVLNDVQEDVDDRALWSTRVTVGWEPIEAIRVNLLWEHFKEDDQRVRTSKQLCHYDPGPETIDGVSWDIIPPTILIGVFARAQTSQGCLPTSLYADTAYETPNGASLPFIYGLLQASANNDAVNLRGIGFNPLVGSGSFNGIPGIDIGPRPEARCALEFFAPIALPIDFCQQDPYGGRLQSRDLRTIHSQIEPVYRASADIFELSLDFDLTEGLTLTSQTVYNEDEYYASQDYNRFSTDPIFQDTSLVCGGEFFVPYSSWFGPIFATPDGQFFPTGLACNPGTYGNGYYNLAPGGVFTDPQLGPSSSLVAQDLSRATSSQFNQEFRLVSNYDAPWNFSLGANFTQFETLNDYFVFANALTYLASIFPFNFAIPQTINGQNVYTPTCRSNQAPPCVYIDPNPLESINGEGHNYFRSANPYELTSSAIFGEIYWQVTETVKFTAGLRMTWDRKVFSPVPSQLLLFDYRYLVPPGSGPEACTTTGAVCETAGTGVNGRGSPANPDIVQEWREPTGRIIVDWKPDLDFTDESMFYASYAHGYKGGGANPPGIAPPAGIINARNSGGAAPPTFQPEFIDAFELGTKNALFGGALILNASAFYYAYEEYQISKIVDRSAANENFDATVWGLESEWIFSPTRNLRLNGTIGYLHTEIGDGERSIDLMDRTQGGNQSFTTPSGHTFDQWSILKPWVTNSSNCVVPTEVLGYALEQLATGNGLFSDLCPGGGILGAVANVTLPDGRTYNAAVDAPPGGGFYADLSGNELPNAPHWTASLGAQYRFELPAGWEATLRGDFYWQDKSFARVYNTEYDRLRAWTNTNISLWFEQRDWGVTAEVYVKNAFDEEPITDAFLNSDDSGLTTNVFTLDPRLVGVSVRKQF